MPAAVPESIGQLQALEVLRIDDNSSLSGTCFCVVPVLHLTNFCITDAEKARVKAALPNCDTLF